MKPLQNLARRLTSASSDENFLNFVDVVETLVSKVLSIAMVGVLLVSVVDLCVFLVSDPFRQYESVTSSEHYGFYTRTLIGIFGLFLNILIALEILENITAYLRKHVVQLELVIVTSLTAVARKIIIFDFSKANGIDLMGLGVAIFSLAISYWIVRRSNR